MTNVAGVSTKTEKSRKHDEKEFCWGQRML